MAECPSDGVEADSIAAEESSEAARSVVASVEEARSVAGLDDAGSVWDQAPNERAAITTATSKALFDFIKRFLIADKGKSVHCKKIGMSWSSSRLLVTSRINSKSILLVDYIELICNPLAETR
jgi:hypothetical protein